MALQIKNEQILNRESPVKLPVSAFGDGPLLEGEKENQSQEMAKNKKKMRGSRGGKKNREKKLKQLKLTLAKKIDSPHLGQSYSKEQLITIWKCQAEKMILPENVEPFEKNGIRVFPVDEDTRAVISETISLLEKDETREVIGSYPYFMQRQKLTEPMRSVIAEIELEPKRAKEKESENEKEEEKERNEELEAAEKQKAVENAGQKAKYPMRPPQKCGVGDGASQAPAKVAREHSLESMHYGMYYPYSMPMYSMPMCYPYMYYMYPGYPGYISPVSSRTTSPSLSPTVPMLVPMTKSFE